MSALHGGSPLESGPTATHLPDKNLLAFILERLQKKDTHGVFSVPVKPNKLPEHHEIIKQPLDFGTIRRKLDLGSYSYLEELEEDVYLICSNARQNMLSDTVSFLQATSIQELAKFYFKSLRQGCEVGEEQEQVIEALKMELEMDIVALEMKIDDVGDDYNIEEVEELTIPKVVKRILNGNTVYEIEVPCLKDDNFIDDSMYRDIEPMDSKQSFADKLLRSKISPMVFECPLCYEACDRTSDGFHQMCNLPCGHVYGASCIEKWLKTDSGIKKCPLCSLLCSLDDVRPFYETSFCIPTADQKTFTRRFPLSNRGFLAFNKFEIARRNVALVKWSYAREQLAHVLRRENKFMKRHTDLLGTMKASEQQVADEYVQQADEYLQKANECKRIAEALQVRATAYNERVNAYLPRLEYFTNCCEEVSKLG